LNNADLLDFLLEGVALTKPGTGEFFNTGGEYWVHTIIDVHTTCAMGAIEYGFTVRKGWNITREYKDEDLTQYVAALDVIKADYCKRYGASIISDNDNYDRDFVVTRVKELVNSQESSS
jgi:hypothetical protein